MHPHSLYFNTVNKKGTVILFHGMTGGPEEFAEIGNELAIAGYKVVIPCLSGHLENVGALKRTHLLKWLADVDRVCSVVSNSSDNCFIGGLSFGSLLALYGALKFQLNFKGIILLAPPLRLLSKTLELQLKLFSMFPDVLLDQLWTIPKRKRPNVKFRIERHDYKFHSFGAAVRLVQLRSMIFKELFKLKLPIITMQDPRDHHLDPKGAEDFLAQIGSEEGDLFWVPGGEHELTIGPEYAKVRNAIVAFIDHYTR